MNINLPNFWFLRFDAIKTPAQTPIYFNANSSDAYPWEQDAPAANAYFGIAHESGPAGSGSTIPADEMGKIAIARHGGVRPNPGMVYPYSWYILPPRGGVNLGLVDGHVEYSSLPNLWQYTWHKDWASQVQPGIGNPLPESSSH